MACNRPRGATPGLQAKAQRLPSGAVMLRITRTSRGGTLWVRLEGSLVGPWVAECRVACARTALEPLLALDLDELRYADEAGVEFLRQMSAAGHIRECPSLVTELMRVEDKP